MDVIKKLEDRFLSAPINTESITEEELRQSLQEVSNSVQIDASLAVLSNLATNTSYIFVGKFGSYFGMSEADNSVLDSIWEEDIYNRIHPEDLFERHLLELEFFNFLKQLPPCERLNYATICKVRAKSQTGDYNYIEHRSSYLRMDENGSLWLALCQYNYSYSPPPQMLIDSMIVNKTTGEKFTVNKYDSCTRLLTERESEVLVCVSKGLMSKEIAAQLHISINTVNRHRQNIIEKLNVNNSMEAVRVANALGIVAG